MEIMGSVFDPNFHQVVQEVPDNSKPSGTIIAEIQSGYMISRDFMYDLNNLD